MPFGSIGIILFPLEDEGVKMIYIIETALHNGSY